MSAIPSQYLEAYENRAPIRMPVSIAMPDGSIEHSHKDMAIPDAYFDIEQEEIAETVREFGEHLTIEQEGRHTFEHTFARVKGKVLRALAHIATIHSSLMINSGQGYEQAIRYRALGFPRRMHVYDGSPGSGGSSFYKSWRDKYYIARHGRFIRDKDGHEPEGVELSGDLAQMLHRKSVESSTEESEVNIGVLTADDPQGDGMTFALGLELTKRGHEIDTIFITNPAKFAKQGLRARIQARQRQAEARKTGYAPQEKPDWEQTPDPHWFDEKKLKGPAEEWLKDGYERVNGTRELPIKPLSIKALKSFIPKHILNTLYTHTLKRTNGSGFVADARAFLEQSPNTNIVIVVPVTSADPEALRQKQNDLSPILGRIALDRPDAKVMAIYPTEMPEKYAGKYTRGVFEGMLHYALELSE